MGLRVASNPAAMNTHRHLSLNSTRIGTSLERLSSGLRINRAADDAAGLAIAEGLRAQVGGTAQALRNTWDAVSLLQTADGALHETTTALQRMRDLAVQAANHGALDTAAKSAIQAEIEELKGQITSIATSTTFTDAPLLDGNYSGLVQLGPNSGDTLSLVLPRSMDAMGLGVTGVNVAALADPGSVTTRPATGRVDQLRLGQIVFIGATAAGDLGTLTGRISYGGQSLDLGAMTYTDTTGDGVAGIVEQVAQLNAAAAAAGMTHRSAVFVNDGDDLIFRGADPDPDATDAELEALSPGYDPPSSSVLTVAAQTHIPPQAGIVTFPGTTAADLPTLRGRITVGGAAFELGSVVYDDTDRDGTISGAEALAQVNAAARAAGITPSAGAFVEGPLRTLSANEYVDHGTLLYFRGELPADDATATEVSALSPVFSPGQDMISMIDGAIQMVSSQRADLGALQNRLEHTIANLGVSHENSAASLSRIRDADMAEEMVIFTRNDVLRQAGTAMLSHANQSAQNALRLLQP